MKTPTTANDGEMSRTGGPHRRIGQRVRLMAVSSSTGEPDEARLWRRPRGRRHNRARVLLACGGRELRLERREVRGPGRELAGRVRDRIERLDRGGRSVCQGRDDGVLGEGRDGRLLVLAEV